MKRIVLLLAACLAPAVSWAWMGMGGSPDYSRDAGNIYVCASTGSVTTQAGVSISSPVLSLYNPFNSGKNLVILDVGIDVTLAPAAASGFFLAYNLTPSSGVAAGTGGTGFMTSGLIGKSTSTIATTSIAKCNMQGILPATPTPFRFLGGTTGAAAISGVQLIDQTNGKVVVPPGGLVSLQATTAANIQAHFTEREDPL